MIQAVSVLASALVAWRLSSTGLWAKYPILFAYMLFRIANLTAFALLDIKSSFYLKAYVLTQPLVWFFYVAVVYELIRLVLSRYRGLYSVAKWVICVAIVISFVISGASMAAHITPQMPQASLAIGLIVAVERSLDFSLALSLLSLLALLSFYAVPLSRNVRVHAVIYTLYFLSSSFSMFLRTVFGLKNVSFVDTGAMAASCLCVLAWFFFLTKKGEETPEVSRRITVAEEERMVRSLETINANLLRIARK